MFDLAPQSASSVIDATRILVTKSARRTIYKKQPTHLKWSKLGFAMQEQCHTNWCWAAVAASVADFYLPAKRHAQCEIANAELQRTDCCQAKCHSPNVPYDQQHTLGAPLHRLRCTDDLGQGGQVGLDRLQEEIAEGRPVCARIKWSGLGMPGGWAAHFVTIVGFLPKTKRISVEDPVFGPTYDIHYDIFCEGYRGIGLWTHTYFTRSPRA